MWLFVFFDLPVKSKPERKRASGFRRDLLANGYSMMQLSVYTVHCTSEEEALTRRNIIRCLLPPHGHVRMLTVTDRQFGRMQVFIGRKPRPPELPPDQLMLF
jgi:CRISPR-associated protein Cas2